MKILIVIACAFSSIAFADVKPVSKQPVKNSPMSFSSQVVEGQIYRPDYSVVTGEAPGEGWGLLRLRDNFRDHATTDVAERDEQYTTQHAVPQTQHPEGRPR